MKGFLYLKKLLLALLFLLALPVMAGVSHNVLIIKSSENRFFNRSIETLLNLTQPGVKYQTTTLKRLEQQPTLQNGTDVIITMGIHAAEYADRTMPHTAVIHSYITEQQFSKHNHKNNHHSILLNQPLQRYLLFIQLLLDAQSIGILHSRHQAISHQTLEQLRKKFGLHIQQSLLDDNDNPISAARDLLQDIDVLLALPDPKIYNRRTLKGILLTTYRQQKPLVTYSPAQVKSGALAAIYSTPENIGKQLSELLNKLLRPPTKQPASVHYARYFDIKINRLIAESLELKIPGREALLERLQQPQDNLEDAH